MKDELRKLIGFLPKEDEFKSRIRLHQGWWRAFVLAEEQGRHPLNENESVCNTIVDGKSTNHNFLSSNIRKAVQETLENRNHESKGIINEARLYNNLLSSQPLCFNFFGELYCDSTLALGVLRYFYPELSEVNQVYFEFAPSKNYTNDNSAFDVAIEVHSGSRKGLIGIECKYTDKFSAREYDKDEYKHIFEASKSFRESYENYIKPKYNQLFRNQLIAEALSLDKQTDFDFVKTGLFCYQNDTYAIETASEFQNMLHNGKEKFIVITYSQFIEAMQKLELTWQQRELSMKLWARYCGLSLSSEFDK